MPIDLGFIVFFMYGFWQGYTRGIINTILNLSLYVFGFVLAFKMAPTTSKIMQTMFHSENPTMFLGAFLANLVLLIVLGRFTARGMEGALRMIYLGMLNRVAGGIVTGGFVVLIYSVLVWFAVKVQFVNDATIRDSRTYSTLEPLPGKAKDFAFSMKPFALDAWGMSMKWMDRLDQYGVQHTEGIDKTYRPPDDPKAIEGIPQSGARPPTNRQRQPLDDSDGIEE